MLRASNLCSSHLHQSQLIVMSLLSEEEIPNATRVVAIVGVSIIYLIGLPIWILAFIGLNRYKHQDMMRIRRPKTIYILLFMGGFHAFFLAPFTILEGGFSFLNLNIILVGTMNTLFFNAYTIYFLIHFILLYGKVKRAGMYLYYLSLFAISFLI